MKALIGMSGGVDSAVAAYRMLSDGWDCIGATMCLYTGQDTAGHDDLQYVEDAKAVAEKMKIPFVVCDFSEEFRDLVMADFARAYQNGLTPNPCIVCNRHLKFDLFLQKAYSLGCDSIVTGHYARIHQLPDGRCCLKKAADAQKDQTYFLYTLTQEQLAHARFPLGEMTKEQARAIAAEQGFANASKRDSQDICFVPDGDYMAFLQRFTGENPIPGNFLDENGKVVGKHKGAAGYTLGQRKGLGLAMGAPVYVCSKDMAANTVTVGPEEKLFRRTLIAGDWNFMTTESLTQPIRVKAKARSRMTEQPATVYPMENGFAKVVFDEPQRAITPGQAVVLYDGDLVVGGGTILEVL